MSNLKIGDKAIVFDLPGVDGKRHSLAGYAGKEIVVVIFTCNHCPYARAWEDRFVQIQADYIAKGVQLLAISSNDAVKHPDDGFEKMKERAAEKSFNFPYLYDESQEVAGAYGAQRTPEVFVFDRKRILRYQGTVDDNYEEPAAVKTPYLRQALDAVLAGKSAPTPETAAVGCTIKWK